MKRNSTLSKILSTRPSIVLKKGRDRFVRNYKLRREKIFDSSQTTYSMNIPKIDDLICNYFKIPDTETLLKFKEIILEKSDQVLNHEFDILGSGPVRVCHGLESPGFGDFKYPPGETYYDKKSYLEENITELNLETSLNIAGLIDDEYELINWNIDLRSGFMWDPKSWFRDIGINSGNGIDTKVPWELGRFQHLIYLAYAYKLAEDKTTGFKNKTRYSAEYKNQILDFISTNPPRFGVQWMSIMDVAIRAVNILIAYDLLKSAGCLFDKRFRKILAESMYDHAYHILWNLEWSSGARGNHYLSNIAGLAFISTYLNRTKFTTAWLAFSIQELISEVYYQFNKDGSNFEASTSYHGLSAEMVMTTLYLLNNLSQDKLRGLRWYRRILWPFSRRLKKYANQDFSVEKSLVLKFPGSFANALSGIASFSESIYKYTENIQIGDNDSGSFVDFIPAYERITNISSFINLKGNKYIKSGYLMKIPVEQFISYSLYNLFDSKYPVDELLSGYYNYLNESREAAEDENDFNSFPDAGLFFYNFPKYNAALRCGSYGQKGKGGHAHNDQLSFVMKVGGTQIIVDPGTYVYTADPDKRNHFRSTEYHNTLQLKDIEQAYWNNSETDDLFWLYSEKTKPGVVRSAQLDFESAHYGFGIKHKRSFNFYDKKFVITDTIDSNDEKSVYIHFAPGISVIRSEEYLIAQKNDIKIKIEIDSETVDIAKYLYSRAYGFVEEADKLIIRTKEKQHKITIEIIG